MTLFKEWEMSAASMGLPDQGVDFAKYFIVRTPSADNLALSLKTGQWVMHERYVDAIRRGLRGGRQPNAGPGAVFLIFAVIGSKHFQGLARVTGDPRAADPALLGPPMSIHPTGPYASVPIQWLRTCASPFVVTKMIRNPLTRIDTDASAQPISASGTVNELPVAMARDFQEVPVRLGHVLVMLCYKSAPAEIDTSALPATATFDGFDGLTPEGMRTLDEEDIGFEKPPVLLSQHMMAVQQAHPQFHMTPQGLGGGGGGGAGGGSGGFQQHSGGYHAGGPMGVSRSSGLSAVAPVSYGPDVADSLQVTRLEHVAPLLGSPRNELISNLLQGYPPPNVPPATVAADAFSRKLDGLLIKCDVGKEHAMLRSGVFTIPEDDAGWALRTITPGTPLFLLVRNPPGSVPRGSSFGHIHGMFIARSQPMRGLVPSLVRLPDITRPVHDPAGPLQVQVLLVADPPPAPEPNAGNALGRTPYGSKIRPGPLPADAVHALSSLMFGALSPQAACATAGYLFQMQEAGMPQDGVLGAGGPVAGTHASAPPPPPPPHQRQPQYQQPHHGMPPVDGHFRHRGPPPPHAPFQQFPPPHPGMR
jgi:hypothetical protein